MPRFTNLTFKCQGLNESGGAVPIEAGHEDVKCLSGRQTPNDAQEAKERLETDAK